MKKLLVLLLLSAVLPVMCSAQIISNPSSDLDQDGPAGIVTNPGGGDDGPGGVTPSNIGSTSGYMFPCEYIRVFQDGPCVNNQILLEVFAENAHVREWIIYRWRVVTFGY